MIDPIRDAIRYATDSRHNGAAYTLQIWTANGSGFEVTVHEDDVNMGYLLRLVTQEGDAWRHYGEIFVNPARVTLVSIIWK